MMHRTTSDELDAHQDSHIFSNDWRAPSTGCLRLYFARKNEDVAATELEALLCKRASKHERRVRYQRDLQRPAYPRSHLQPSNTLQNYTTPTAALGTSIGACAP